MWLSQTRDRPPCPPLLANSGSGALQLWVDLSSRGPLGTTDTSPQPQAGMNHTCSSKTHVPKPQRDKRAYKNIPAPTKPAPLPTHTHTHTHTHTYSEEILLTILSCPSHFSLGQIFSIPSGGVAPGRGQSAGDTTSLSWAEKMAGDSC